MTEEIFTTLVHWMPVLWLATLSCIVLLWVTLAISLLLAQLRPTQQASKENGQRAERTKEEIRSPRPRLPRPVRPTVQPAWHQQQLPPQ